jgi:hypothetical protein
MAMEMQAKMTQEQRTKMMEMQRNMDPAMVANAQKMMAGMDPNMMKSMMNEQSMQANMDRMMEMSPEELKAQQEQAAKMMPAAAASSTTTDPGLIKAEKFKTAGNELFKRKSYEAAVKKYEVALSAVETAGGSATQKQTLWSALQNNIAQTQLSVGRRLNLQEAELGPLDGDEELARTSSFARAVSACDSVILNASSSVDARAKAYYRRGRARRGQAMLVGAVKDLRVAKRLFSSPKDKTAVAAELEAVQADLGDEVVPEESEAVPSAGSASVGSATASGDSRIEEVNEDDDDDHNSGGASPESKPMAMPGMPGGATPDPAALKQQVSNLCT